MQLGFVLAIVTVFLWGSDAIFAKLSVPKLGLTRVAILIVVVDGITYFLGFCYWRDNLSIGLGDGFLAATSCIVGTVAYTKTRVARMSAKTMKTFQTRP